MRERHGEPEESAADRLIGAPKPQNCRSGVGSTDLRTVNTRLLTLHPVPATITFAGTYFCAGK
jgi:hypothetical protein